jgi:predicted small secreted protein
MQALARRVLPPCVLVATVAVCQTVAGFGKDAEKPGRRIEQKARK